ncbi:MAG: HAD-IIA family hydrolase [Acidimicrobiales bacterium]|nr:HAD-IIA family hydrolase [Acidimicrobiales bacterium]|tara:strand:+ start:5822 stop:6565 length:744 start_codon:yes stop_codon:yes gene_type:complete
MTWALDLDGVVWLGDKVIQGVGESITFLREKGEQVFFVTNNSGRTVSEVEEKLNSFNIEPNGGVITSAMAMATLLSPDETVLTLCGKGAVEEMEKVGAKPVKDGKADSVVVGFHEDFDYWKLTAALQAIDSGARLLATNDDLTYPSHDGIRPGAGSILASLVAATEAVPEIAGKPYQPMCDLLNELSGGNGIMVGDRPDTDGRFAKNLGWDFGLVLSGVTKKSDLPVDPPHDFLADDLPDMVEQIFS